MPNNQTEIKEIKKFEKKHKRENCVYIKKEELSKIAGMKRKRVD